MTFWKSVLSLAFISGGSIIEVLNVCILNAKYYIHNKRLLYDNTIEFLHYLYVYVYVYVLKPDTIRTLLYVNLNYI